MHDGSDYGLVLLPLPDGRERVFARPVDVVTANACSEVPNALRWVQHAVDRGMWAAGFLAYEAGPAFDDALAMRAPYPRLPLAWFGIYHTCTDRPAPAPEPDPAIGACAGREGGGGAVCSSFDVGPWTPLVGEADYHVALARIREYIAAGDTYQVNYTFPMHAPFRGNSLACFRQLCARQRSAQAAYVDAGRFKVLSASPELFFELAGDLLITRPMKGTRPRGRFAVEDDALARELAASEKDRAENVMIVDLIRNDLGRITPYGAVEVGQLFQVERYDTVWQMTSTVAAHTSASVPSIFRALFPCGSVTGAPKVRTSQIIQTLEPHPRGVYCGAVGWWGPRRRARFNVAIRTVLVDAEKETAAYHVGSGITWDSDATREYQECFDKAALLTHRRPVFHLLETLRLDDDGYFLRDAHLARLSASAAYFGWEVDMGHVEQALDTAAKACTQRPARVRLMVDAAGRPRVETGAYTPLNAPVRVAFAKKPVDDTDVFLFHKTTHRTVYDNARTGHPDVDDVILWNAAGEVTETTIANIVAEIDGEKFSPPVACGLLGGVMRAHLLETSAIRERIITRDQLRRATRLWLINSVRGWVEARLAP
ncbi:MAG: aminodeoxychorismate synthase component I [Candidatus Hydrogenedentota bacterium]